MIPIYFLNNFANVSRETFIFTFILVTVYVLYYTIVAYNIFHGGTSLMKTKNKLLTLLLLATGATAVTAFINKAVKMAALSKNRLNETKPLCYRWRLGNVYYTKGGSGKPLLLIHDLDNASSSYEWSQIVTKLEENYTVYAIDLLGCGRSEKPMMTYTNYLYVQMISDFIKSEIGHRTNVVATGDSGSFIIMACNNNPELFDQIMLVNPKSLLDFCQLPGKSSKLYKCIIDIPVLGTLLYHISCSKQAITNSFFEHYFYNPYAVQQSMVDIYHEAAHSGLSPKSVYSSAICNFTKCNIVNSLKKINNSIYLVGGSGINEMERQLNEYRDYNPAVEITMIKNAKLLPQLESPGKFIEVLKMYFG